MLCRTLTLSGGRVGGGVRQEESSVDGRHVGWREKGLYSTGTEKDIVAYGVMVKMVRREGGWECERFLGMMGVGFVLGEARLFWQ